ncbi:hypothetical protein BKA61DRAFT_604285 [Leptodontidium sp. MPI-SDFR-AT-0119]|nr:hypothetical protein BKA61DRAFT_604285 [Leptodontidium sp. MPI-SDFR-AT-0119]
MRKLHLLPFESYLLILTSFIFLRALNIRGSASSREKLRGDKGFISPHAEYIFQDQKNDSRAKSRPRNTTVSG